jgi:alpha-1,2-mannosyltransferase
MRNPLPLGSLAWWQRLGVLALLAGFVVLGVATENRSAFSADQMGDLAVYLRAAWAVRSDRNIYEITDHHAWHYHYPPCFAILMTPLAVPPDGTDAPGTVSYPVAVAVWYIFSSIVLFLGVHLLASAVEQTPPYRQRIIRPWGSRRWWALRFYAVIGCLPAVAHTLARGQVNLLVLFLLCGMAAAVLRKQNGRAGLWLAGAICIKVIPAFLLLYPLWRRDRRLLAGCAVGLLVGLLVIPTAVFGLPKTVAYAQQWIDALLMPVVAGSPDVVRTKELTGAAATHSQSFLIVLHKSLHVGGEVPMSAAPGVRRAHWALAALLTVITLWSAGRRRSDSSVDELLFLGSLILLSVLTSPVCYPHYLALALPLVLGLLAAVWQQPGAPFIDGPVLILLVVNCTVYIFMHVPGLEVLMNLGGGLYASLLLWLWAVRHLVPRAKTPMVKPELCKREAVAAA